MKKYLYALLLIPIAAGIFFGMQFYRTQQVKAVVGSFEIEPVQSGTLSSVIDANGFVRANQEALLFWKTSGRIEQLDISPGDFVTTDQVLAVLDPDSLPQHVILAKNNQVQAEKTLEELLTSQSQYALALQAVETAERNLENTLDPILAQANAQAAIADAEKAIETAERNLAIVQVVPSQEAIAQAYANVILAEDQLAQTQKEVDKIERRLNIPESKYYPWESKSRYRKILQSMQLKLAADAQSLEQANYKYQQLLTPPNEIDVLAAQAAVATSQARLGTALQEWERIKDGYSDGETAVLQAQLHDAQRELDRLASGPDPLTIASLEAQIAAAEATMAQVQIKAPFNAVVTAAYLGVGDSVSPGSMVFRLDDISTLLVDIRVSEIDINFIQIGQASTVTFDGIPGRSYAGKVQEVSMVGDTIGGLVTFNVVVALTAPDEMVRPGMSADVEVVTQEVEQTLLVPNKALRMVDGHRVVYILENGFLRPVEVELGSSTNQYSELVGGNLQEGDQVIVNLTAEALEAVR